jgi:hypothetical protein
VNEHKKNLIKLIEQASHRYSTCQVFGDFAEMAALSISNNIRLDNIAIQEGGA